MKTKTMSLSVLALLLSLATAPLALGQGGTPPTEPPGTSPLPPAPAPAMPPGATDATQPPAVPTPALPSLPPQNAAPAAPKRLERVPQEAAPAPTPTPAPDAAPAPTPAPQVAPDAAPAPAKVPARILMPNSPRPFDVGAYTWQWVRPEVNPVAEKIWIPGLREMVLDGTSVTRVVDACGFVHEVCSPSYRWVSTPGRYETRTSFQVVKPGYWVPVPRSAAN